MEWRVGRLSVSCGQTPAGRVRVGLTIVDDTDLADFVYRFDAVLGIHLIVDVLQVGLDGHRCDVEPCGDFLVAQTLGQ